MSNIDASGASQQAVCVDGRAEETPVPTEILAQNRAVATPFIQTKTQREAGKNWDKFYKAHADRFFKDRHWTDREFDELKAPDGDSLEAELASGAFVLLEVGCGVGNTVYPLLEKNAALKVHCCDFSPRAVEMVKAHPAYNADTVNAFVYDLSEASTASLLSNLRPDWPPVSVLSLIFVLSAIPPQQHVAVVRALVHAIPVGSSIVFRDYARGDLAQLRFHTKRDAQWAEPSLLSDEHDWYRRGDNTMAYFFTPQEVTHIAEAVGGLEGEAREVVKVNTNRRTGAVMVRRFVQARWKRIA
ncbi:hypothetical protein MCUN1_003896 [Malassezia cuniculi]|uniref:tRNA N(3)-methylcytidine methyltransferase n=1 Tax=Malassezia cuniculi TaxID=948313 RepID=A0AAF0J8M3_9BASI|nr:hypothetical protein MCUN1_003896 [Malassezia cuniculi]